MEILTKEILINIKGIQIINLLDESIVFEIRKALGLTQLVRLKVLRMIQSTIETSIKLILLSCSSISPLVGDIQSTISVPIISIDGLFFQEIVKDADKLLILGTSLSALKTVKSGIEFESNKSKKDMQIKAVCCKLNNQNTPVINISEYYLEMAAEIEQVVSKNQNFDKVLFAQISMVPLLRYLNEHLRKKIQHSIPFAIKNIKERLYYQVKDRY